MRMNLTMNIMVVMVTMIVKMMNATVNVMIETVELIYDMANAMRKNKSAKAIVRMMVVIVVVKIIETTINNTVSVCVNIINAVAKVVSVKDVIEMIEVLIVTITALITSVADACSDNRVAGNTTGIAAVVVAGVVIITNTIVAATYDGSISKITERLSCVWHNLFLIPLR